METIISEAIERGTAAGLQRSHSYRETSLRSEGSVDVPVRGNSSGGQLHHQRFYCLVSSEYSDSHENMDREMELSEDKSLSPDQPDFIGLFRHQLFKSLLYKAKTTARLAGHRLAADPLLTQSMPGSLSSRNPKLKLK